MTLNLKLKKQQKLFLCVWLINQEENIYRQKFKARTPSLSQCCVAVEEKYQQIEIQSKGY